MAAGVAKGQPTLILASDEHLRAIYKRLSHGFDIAALERDGLLMAWSAEATINDLVPHSEIDERVLARTDAAIADISDQGRRFVRIYGEIAGLLWQRNLRACAARLEAYADGLTRSGRVLSICGYEGMAVPRHSREEHQICGFHTSVLGEHWTEPLASAVQFA